MYIYIWLLLKPEILTSYIYGLCACGKIEKNEMVRAFGAYGEERGVHRVLVGKPEGKRSLGRPRSRWEDNIKMDVQEVVEVVGTGWSWLRIGTGGGDL
jgi:alpha-galactosidase